MGAEELSDLHLADLHAQAAEAGINGFRMLRRDELIAELEEGGSRKRSRRPRRRAADVDPETDTDELSVLSDGDVQEPEDEEPSKARPARRRGRRGGRGRGSRERLAEDAEDRERPDPASEETAEVTGILEITRQRHGFLSVEGSDDDVYVSASQVRRCEMKDGDEVTGPVREPRRGERHRALVRVNEVNGAPPVEAPERKSKGAGRAQATADTLDAKTPVPPARRIELPAEAGVLARAADLLAPLAKGQRVLVKAAPRSGRTLLLRGLADALSEVEELELTILLIDERPEEISAWEEAAGSAELLLAPADLSPAEQVKVAQAAMERVRVQASEGADAVLLCDSLSRLAIAAGGVDEVKRLFGSGRELAEDGSLTVIATALGEADDDGSALKAVATTETSQIVLDPTLAAEGISPALRFGECRAVGEENILSEPELDGLRHLRGKLSDLVPPEAAGLVRNELEATSSNAAVLRALA